MGNEFLKLEPSRHEILPYSYFYDSVHKSDKCKRHHNEIFDMYYEYIPLTKIAKILTEKYGVHIDRRTVGIYVHRCFDEIGRKHEYIPKLPPGKCFAKFREMHDKIYMLKNYYGLPNKEIAKILGFTFSSLNRYTVYVSWHERNS